MRIVKPSTLAEYARRYPDAEAWLVQWAGKARKADWRSLQDVRVLYPHADAATVASGRTVTVFNVKGNRYRLVVAINYRWAMVYVLRFLTHAQYSKDQWKGEL